MAPSSGQPAYPVHEATRCEAEASAGRAHVVWTGLNRFAVSPQIDPYVGGPHDGYAQDATYARRP